MLWTAAVVMKSSLSGTAQGKVKHVEMNMTTSDAGPLDPSLMIELEKHRWDREPTAWSQ